MIQQQKENDLDFNIYSKHQENVNIFPYTPLQYDEISSDIMNARLLLTTKIFIGPIYLIILFY